MTMFANMLLPTRDWRVAYICLALRLLNTVGAGLAGTALLRLFEANICRQHYRQMAAGLINFEDEVPEMKCKVDGVQSEMSNVAGIDNTISLITMLIVLLPYLIWSRSVSQKLLLLIYFIGFLASTFSYAAILYYYNIFDIRLIWVTNIFTLIGGGHVVFRSVVSSIAAQALPKESLTTYYLYSTAVLLAVGSLSSAAGLQLMKVSLWSAVALGIGVNMLSIPVLTFLDDDEPLADFEPLVHNHKPVHELSLWHKATDKRRDVKMLLKTMRQHRFCLLIFLIHKCGSSFHTLQPQWMSKRYDMTLREIGYVQLGEEIWITIFLSLIPHFHKYLARRDPSSKDAVTLNLVTWSVVAAAVGTAMLSLSWAIIPAAISLVVAALGSGFYDMMLGLVTMKMDKASLIQVYMCISIVEDIGGRIASISIYAIYGLSVRMNSFVGMALPLWVCVAFFMGSLSLLRYL